MLHSAITYLNGLLASGGWFEKNYGLVVLIRRTEDGDEKQYPAEYCGNNEYTKVTDFSEKRGSTYWRLTGDVAVDQIESPGHPNPISQVTYPLRLFCVVNRSLFSTSNDDAYTEDRLFISIKKQFNNREKPLRTQTNSVGARLNVNRLVVNQSDLVSNEFVNTDINKHSEYSIMAMDMDLQLQYRDECAVDICDNDVNRPTGLTATANGSDIDLSWTENSSNEDGFQIFRSATIDGAFNKIGSVAANVTTYTDTSPTSNVVWFYRVRAYDGSSVSTFSNIAAAYIASGAVLPATASAINSESTVIGGPTSIDSGDSGNVSVDDISITLNGGDEIKTSPAGITVDIDVEDGEGSNIGVVSGGKVIVAKSGIAYHDLPSTGDLISTGVGQDRWWQLNDPGWTPPSNPLVIPRVDPSDIYSLSTENVHGNNAMFTLTDGTVLNAATPNQSANTLIEEHFHGLMYMVIDTSFNYTNILTQITAIHGVEISGYSDWRICNYRQAALLFTCNDVAFPDFMFTGSITSGHGVRTTTRVDPTFAADTWYEFLPRLSGVMNMNGNRNTTTGTVIANTKLLICRYHRRQS